MVSIIIAHFKNSHNLEECLKSVLAQTYNPKEIIVINNCGKEPMGDYIKKFPRVKFIRPEQNLFYSPAQNLGIKESQGKFIIFLNDDVILNEDFISQLVESMNYSKDIGMASGKILRMDKVTVDTAGQFLGKDRRPIERGWQTKDQGQYDFYSYIFSPGGVAPLYRRETLDELAINGEYFDEDFKIFYEDLDLAWRANRFGWRSFYSPLALAYHHRGASTQSVQPEFKFLRKYYFSGLPQEIQMHLVKNRYLTMLKNDSLGGFLINLPSILIYEAKLWTYILVFRPGLVLDLVKNRGSFGKAWKKRKIITQRLREKLSAKIPY